MPLVVTTAYSAVLCLGTFYALSDWCWSILVAILC